MSFTSFRFFLTLIVRISSRKVTTNKKNFENKVVPFVKSALLPYIMPYMVKKYKDAKVYPKSILIPLVTIRKERFYAE